jgi:hypothetical protein
MRPLCTALDPAVATSAVATVCTAGSGGTAGGYLWELDVRDAPRLGMVEAEWRRNHPKRVRHHA